MIGVEEKERIRKARFRKGRSIRWIAKNYHHSRPAVRKALKDASAPVYKRSKEPAARVLGPFKAIIRGWLEEDKTAPKKQRHTGKRIFDRLKEECGYEGAKVTVYKYLEKVRPSLRDVYVPIAYEPGKEAQVDFAEAWAKIAGELTRVHLFGTQLPYSTARFARAYPTERREAFFDGVQESFHYFEGVPDKVTFDNPRTLVKKLYRGHKRDEQADFIAFRSHFMFAAHFCNPGCPNEKGHVEGLGGVLRRNVFVPVPEVDSLDTLNNLILNWCRKDLDRVHPGGKGTVRDYLKEERKRFLPLPEHKYSCCRRLEAVVNKFSEIRLDYNLYSVPLKYAHKPVSVKAYWDRVKIVKDNRVIARHLRCYGRNQEVLEPLHYVPILERKPNLLEHGKPFRDWKLPEVFEKYRNALKERVDRPEREYIRLLLLHRECTTERIAAALSRAIAFGCYNVDAVRLFLYSKEHENHAEDDGLNRIRLDTGAWPRLDAIRVDKPDIKGFNRLLELKEVSLR